MFSFAPLCLVILFLTNDGDDADGDGDAKWHALHRHV